MSVSSGHGVSGTFIPKKNLDATVSPSSTDDVSKEYSAGSHWVDVAADNIYVCVDNTLGAAIWVAVDGDISAVIAGTGLTGGGTAGAVTLNVDVGAGANQIPQLDSSAKMQPLHMQAGTTTAGTAPLKFTDGTVMTIPEAGALEFENGHLYFTSVGERRVITTANAVKDSTTTVTNTTTETTVYTKTIAANELHVDQIMEALVTGSISNASASDDYTLRVKLGGTTLHTVARTGGNVTDVGWSLAFFMTVRTQGVSGSIIDYANWHENGQQFSSSDNTLHTMDTTGTLTFEITVQWTNAKAGNTISASQGFVRFNH